MEVVADLRTNFSSWSGSDLRSETAEAAAPTLFQAPSDEYYKIALIQK